MLRRHVVMPGWDAAMHVPPDGFSRKRMDEGSESAGFEEVI